MKNKAKKAVSKATREKAEKALVKFDNWDIKTSERTND